MSPAIATARSLLFVPGDRPERFSKAIASGADAVIIDLEDAVSSGRKHLALAATLAWLAHGDRAVVRVNAVGTSTHGTELEALRSTGATIMLPKADCAPDIADVAARLGDTAAVVALIETARGVQDADAVCGAPGVVRVAIGNVDLSAELGVDHASHAALAYARGRLVAASAAAGLPAPIDGVTTVLDAPDLLAADLAHGRELGFGGKLCIHPRQVDAVHRAYSPTSNQLDWAHRVLAAVEHGDGVNVLDGAMIDAPVVLHAERIVAQARSGAPDDRG